MSDSNRVEGAIPEETIVTIEYEDTDCKAMPEGVVLIIEDEFDDLIELAKPLLRLKTLGHIGEVLTATNSVEAVDHVSKLNEALDRDEPALIVLDLSLPEADLPDLSPELKQRPPITGRYEGLQILEKMRTRGLRHDVPVLIRSYHWMRLREEDYPTIWEHYGLKGYALKNYERNGQAAGVGFLKTMLQVSRLLWRTRLPSHYAPREADYDWLKFVPLIGPKALLDRIAKDIGEVHVDKSILICGDSGTGKWVAASAVHLATAAVWDPPRKSIEFDCTDLKGEYPRDEFFKLLDERYSKHVDRTTEFDVILRKFHLLDERKQALFAPLASKRSDPSFPVNIRRLILLGSGSAGDFCQEIRDCVLTIELPPLGAYGGDLPVFINYFLKRFHERAKRDAKKNAGIGMPEENRAVPTLDADAIHYLETHQWQNGNGRKLLDMIGKAYNLWLLENLDGPIRVDHLR